MNRLLKGCIPETACQNACPPLCLSYCLVLERLFSGLMRVCDRLLCDNGRNQSGSNRYSSPAGVVRSRVMGLVTPGRGG